MTDGGNIPIAPLSISEYLGSRFKNIQIQKRLFFFLLLSFVAMQNIVGQIAGPCGTTITVTNATNPSATDGKIVLTPTLTNNNYYVHLGIVGSEMYGEMLKTTASSKLVLTGLVAGTYNVRLYRTDTTGLILCGETSQTVTVGAGSFATCLGTEIGGNVFHDANANGTREAGEGGAAGITVRAYNSAGTLVATQTSSATGVFKFTGLTATQPYRLEYSWADGYLQSGALGSSSGSSVQFVTSGTCAANFGINYPANYCQTSNPYVVTPCYINGNPQAAAVAPLDVMVAFPYKAANDDLGVPGQNIAPTHVATASQIGATWGVAYQKTTKYAFTSAVLRRFAGFGPLGTGGIYKVNMTNPTAPAVSNWIDVKTIGINTGNDTRNGTAANTLSIAPGSPAWDAEAYNQIGKIGIGGIDFNDRGDTLWLMNLADKKLYGIRNVNPSVTPTASNVIGGYTVALPAGYTCATNANDFRPWAVKYYKGLVYVGAVCSGESTPWSSFNLRGFVLSFNPANPAAGFTYVTDFPLDYTRYPFGTASTFTFQTWLTNATAQFTVAQPIVTDLEFDLDGSMIVALGDRGGLQGGNNNYYADPTATNITLLESNSYGDILRFCKTGSTYIQSGVASCPNPTENIFPTPEYYWGDTGPLTNSTAQFNEGGAGSIAFLAGSGSVLETAQDAYGWYSGGTISFSNRSGGDLWRYTVFDPSNPGAAGKATGLGDIELLCDPAPIEIGNRVWMDTDKDGIQDAGEPGIAGVQVLLFQGSTFVAIVVTDANGNYKFTGLLPNTAYTIIVPLVQAAIGNGFLSTLNAGSNDLIDNDMMNLGSNGATDGIISLTTGNYGENNHTYDIGFLPCFITLNTNVSSCFDSNGNTAGGTNVVNVQVIVDWANNPSGETINVTCTGATAQSINPATSTNPAILNFVVPANGANVTIAAAFSTTTTCSASLNVTAPAGNCLLEPCVAGNTGGKVWLDYNSNGIKDAGETTGVEGVIVKAYNAAGTLVETDTTDYSGQYTFTTFTPTGTNKYRIEFTNIPPQYKPTFNGTDGRTDVQFVSAADCTVDFGVNNPVDYCQDNPALLIPCYGSGTITGNTDPAVVRLPYTANGVPAMQGGSGVNPSVSANISSVGTLWGAATQPDKRRVFMSAFLKRHSGLGPLGLGGVYVFDYTGATSQITGSFNLQSVTPANGGAAIDLGTVIRTGSTDYTLPAPGQPSIDLDAFDKVGKVGFGDADMGEDGKTLWLVNLNQRALVSVDVSGATGSLPGTVNQYILSSLPGAPTCANGVLRPFGLGFSKGKGYIGCECTAENGGTSADLRTYILSFNPQNITAGLTIEINFGMTYNRELQGGWGLQNWQPWLTAWNSNLQNQNYHYPQPILSDIEIDQNGNMTVGMMDRTANQLGYANYPAVSGYSGSANTYGISTGDISRICKVNGAWVLEGNAGCPTSDPGGFTPGSMTNDGLTNNGEFYWADYLNTGGEHEEIALGALAGHLTQNKIITTVMDPVNTTWTQGLHWYDLNTAARTQSFQIVPNLANYFGKAAGLGDIGMLCSPAPLQIGNYVWLDTDKDGVQDANEKPLSNVTVTLWKNNVKIATIVTNAAGEYYFSDKNAAGVTWTGSGADTTLVPNTNYQIKIYRKQPVLDTTVLTTANSIINGGTDLNDSDASMVGDTAVISLTTGTAGSNNHTYDFGFFACTNAITLTTQPAGFSECLGGTLNLTVVASGGTSPPYTYKWQNGGATGTTWTDISGANAATYTPLSTSVGTTMYRVIVTSVGGTICDTIISSAATVIIVNDPVVTVTTLPTTVCVGANLALTANRSGGTGTCTVQWQSSPNGTTWTNVSGATSNTLNVNSINSTTRYRAIMTCTGNGCCN